MIKRLPAVALIVLAGACNTVDPGPEATPVDQLEDLVQDVQVTPTEGDAYHVRVEMDTSGGVLLPEAIRVLAHEDHDRPTVLFDDGLHDDGEAGDGVFAGSATDACVPNDTASKADISCKIKFVGPGEQCGNWGTCPESASRSFLWGLIEYDTDIVVCFCIDECEVGN